MKDRNTQSEFYSHMSTPWGGIQHYDKLAEGVICVHTAGHGGLWLSDERIAALPEHYEPFTGTKRWAEEDEDAGLVLQYLGLLSLIDEPLTLHVTEADIEKGRESCKGLYREKWLFLPDGKDTGLYGGAIVEAYQRQTGDDCGEMVCSYHLSPVPGGFKLAKMCDKARTFMAAFDKGELVKPATFVLEPYRVLERVEFVHHLKGGGTRTDRVSGYLAKSIREGDAKQLEFYQSIWIKADVIQVSHEGIVFWKRP